MLLNMKMKYFALLKGPIDGYKFPVYTTPSCPKNETEWLERSLVLNCTDQNGYMCIPNEMLTDLVEFCYTKDAVFIPKGKNDGEFNEISINVMNENQLQKGP